MAFKFPRISIPLGGGARTIDPDTAIVGDLTEATAFDSLTADTRFGDAPYVRARSGSTHEGRLRHFTVPLVGQLPLRRQLSVLFPLIALSLLLAFLFMWLDSARSTGRTDQAQLVGDSQMHVQRLAKAAPNALRGQPDAFRQLDESRMHLTQATAALQSGGVVGVARVPAIEPAMQASMQTLAETWKRTEQAASTLLKQRPQLVAIAAGARAIEDATPRLTELTEQVLALKVASGGSASEVAAAAQLMALTQRLSRNAAALAAGGAATPEVSAVIARDATAWRDIVDGLLLGNDGRRLAPPRDAETRQRLAELKATFLGIQNPIGTLIDGIATLQAARAAEQRIAGDSEPLRDALSGIAAGLGAERGGGRLHQGIVALFLVVAVLAAIALGLVHYQDMHRRAAEADLQRAEAERLEQEAKRANDQNQAAILRLMNELQEVADGDLTVQATVSEDITGAIADSVNYTVEELRDLVSRINTTAELVNRASSEAQEISSRLQAASAQQSREIRETGESVLRMATQINEVSASASESASVARQSLRAAEQGRRAVQNSIAGMNGIRDQIQETAKRIKRLGESSQEIGEIVELISDITEQTNVLALNAAIQAASAGEAGRGFTVVAEEVQRLAERSAEATKQISALIRTIQTDTQDAVAAMERSTQGVVAGTRLSDDAGNALGDIGRVSSRLAEMIEAISTTTSEQAASAGTVAHSIQRILLVTEQTNEGTQQTAGSIQQLAELARELKNSVSRFRVA
jgi:twitching motility protein PilJ